MSRAGRLCRWMLSILLAATGSLFIASERWAVHAEQIDRTNGGWNELLLIRGQVEFGTREDGSLAGILIRGQNQSGVSPFKAITTRVQWDVWTVHDGWRPKRLLLPEFGRVEAAPDDYRVVNTIPLWPLWGLMLIPTAAWWVHVIRVDRGRQGRRCVSCEYDTRGIASGICPECGQTVDALNW